MKGKHSQSHEAYLTDKNYCRVHVIHDVCLMSEKVWRLVFIFQPCPSSADITHPLPSTPLEQVSLLGELLKMPSYQEDKSSLKQLEAAKYPPDLLSYRMIQCLIVCIKSHCVVLMQKVVRPLYIEWWCSEARCLHRAKIILNGNTHRNHCRFNLLLPDIRYRSNCCCTARLWNSFRILNLEGSSLKVIWCVAESSSIVFLHIQVHYAVYSDGCWNTVIVTKLGKLVEVNCFLYQAIDRIHMAAIFLKCLT